MRAPAVTADARDGAPGIGQQRSFTKRPGHAIVLAVAIALVTVWASIAVSHHTNWPLGLDVGVIAAGFYLAGSGWTAIRRRWSARQPAPELAPAL
jgi:ABC-type Mn2+/Zn2+ transport system permease subunit